MNSVMSLCRLFDAVATPENGVNAQVPKLNLEEVKEFYLLFCRMLISLQE
jgi:hypothetical protein